MPGADALLAVRIPVPAAGLESAVPPRAKQDRRVSHGIGAHPGECLVPPQAALMLQQQVLWGALGFRGACAGTAAFLPPHPPALLPSLTLALSDPPAHRSTCGRIRA
eukprot:1978767-Rhodomonas_salina.1